MRLHNTLYAAVKGWRLCQQRKYQASKQTFLCSAPDAKHRVLAASNHRTHLPIMTKARLCLTQMPSTNAGVTY